MNCKPNNSPPLSCFWLWGLLSNRNETRTVIKKISSLYCSLSRPRHWGRGLKAQSSNQGCFPWQPALIERLCRSPIHRSSPYNTKLITLGDSKEFRSCVPGNWNRDQVCMFPCVVHGYSHHFFFPLGSIDSRSLLCCCLADSQSASKSGLPFRSLWKEAVFLI